LKDRVNIILFLVTGLISIAGIVIGVVGDSSMRAKQLCPAIQACICDSDVNKFADEKDIVKIIDSRYGGYKNVPVGSINLSKMEKVLLGIDFVESACCYITRDGMLHVEVTQTTPVAKYNDGEDLIYLSAEGKCMKTRKDWNNALICLGGAPLIDDDTWRRRIGECCEMLLGSQTGLGTRVQTIDCTANGECTLLLEGREERFLLGQPENAGVKLDKVVRYERQIAPTRTDDSEKKPYNIVDVRFKGQIICK